jgi:hypothetical protein
MQAKNDLSRFNLFILSSETVSRQILLLEKTAEYLFRMYELRQNGSQADFEFEALDDETLLVEFNDDAHEYMLQTSWIKELELIGEQHLSEGFDRGTRIVVKPSNTDEQPKMEFNGILPSIWTDESGKPMIRISRDGRNGARTLGLVVGETTFQNVLLLRDLSEDYDIHRNVTLSMLLFTADHKLLWPTRSQEVLFYPGAATPSVNGNLDIPSRYFGNTDGDEFGNPDMRRAIVREAKEEFNLDLDIERVITHGIGRVYSDQDNGTWVLALSYQSDLTADEIQKRFEVGSNIVGKYEIDAALEFHDVESIVSDGQVWLAEHRHQMMPHLRIALVAWLKAAKKW